MREHSILKTQHVDLSDSCVPGHEADLNPSCCSRRAVDLPPAEGTSPFLQPGHPLLQLLAASSVSLHF